jgi:hypothetical protein
LTAHCRAEFEKYIYRETEYAIGNPKLWGKFKEREIRARKKCGRIILKWILKK